MEPNSNFFTNRKEVFFVEYDGVIKNPNQYLLYLIFNELYDTYKDYLFLDKYKGLTLDNALVLATSLPEENIIKIFSREEMDYKTQYDELSKWDDDLYSNCEILKMADVISNSLQKPFLDKVYFYSKEYDKRVEDDIREIYGNGARFAYCYGDLPALLEMIPEEITAVFLGNYDTLYGFSKYSKMDFTEIYISDDVRNGYQTDDGKYIPFILEPPSFLKDLSVKLHSFKSIEFRNKHMEGIIEPILDKYIKLKEEKQTGRDVNNSN